jgi:hypothetical protein
VWAWLGRFPEKSFFRHSGEGRKPARILLQFAFYPGRITPAIKYGINPDFIILDSIVNREWESLREHPVVITKIEGMDACK